VRDGIIEQASPSLSNILGWEKAEGVGRPFTEFVHPGDIDIVLAASVLDHQVRAYGESGMNGCIAKPVSPAAMIAGIARLAELPVAVNVA